MDVDSERELVRKIVDAAVIAAKVLLETDQEMLESLLTDKGMLHPEPIPASTDHGLLFRVDYSLIPSLSTRPAVQRLLTDERLMLEKHRMSVTEFLLVHEGLVEGAGSAARLEHEYSRALTTAEHLLVWLEYTRGDTRLALRRRWGIRSDSALDAIVDRVTRCINTTNHVQWPNAAARQALHGWLAVSEDVIAIMDAVPCETGSSSGSGRQLRSASQPHCTPRYLVCVSPMGEVVYVEGPIEGTSDDHAAFERSAFASDARRLLSPGELLLAGEQFDCKLHGPVVCSIPPDVISADRDADMQLSMRMFNEELDEGRRMARHVFAWLGEKATIIARRFPADHTAQSDLFRACCRVYNFLHMRRQIYANKAQSDTESPRVLSAAAKCDHSVLYETDGESGVGRICCAE